MRNYLFTFLLFFFSLTSSSQKKADSVNLSEKKAEHYLEQLQLEYRNGKYENHKKYSDSLYTIAKENGLVKQQILAMVNQAVYHNNKSEQNTSITLYRNALKLCETIPEDYRTKIIVLVNLGNVYNKIEAYEKGKKTMNEVLDYLDHKENNQNIKAAAHIGIATSYEGLKNHDSTLVHLFKAKEIGVAKNDESILATVLSNLSDTYYHQGDYQKAKQTGEEALQLSTITKPGKKRAWLLLTLGLSESKLGNLNQAIAYFTESQELAITHKLTQVEMHSYEHLEEVYIAIKDLNKAKENKEKYLVLQNKFLANQKEATKLDLEKDLNAKDAIITSNETTLSILLNKQSKLIFGSTIAGLILSIILFFVIKKKKQQAAESELLKKQLVALKKSSALDATKQTSSDVNQIKNVQYKNSSLTPEDHANYKKELLVLMNTKKPYVNYNLSQTDLASQLDISSNHLSEVLRFAFDQNFYNFINSYRVLEAQKLITSTSHKNAKLLAIAFDSGFKSKTSFNRVFKTYTGLTPSEYRKKALS